MEYMNTYLILNAFISGSIVTYYWDDYKWYGLLLAFIVCFTLGVPLLIIFVIWQTLVLIWEDWYVLSIIKFYIKFHSGKYDNFSGETLENTRRIMIKSLNKKNKSLKDKIEAHCAKMVLTKYGKL